MRYGLVTNHSGVLPDLTPSAVALRAAGVPIVALYGPMTGWQRQRYGESTGLPWVMPSMNLPTVDTAVVYPGTVLFEGTNASEGRGTTRPFELVGAPYVDGRWVAELRAEKLPGVLFRDVRFRPVYGRHAGATVRGVQVHVVDRASVAPVRTALEMIRLLRALYPVDFGWRQPVAGARHFIDLLWGSATLRTAVDGDRDPVRLLDGSPVDVGWAGDVLLYE